MGTGEAKLAPPEVQAETDGHGSVSNMMETLHRMIVGLKKRSCQLISQQPLWEWANYGRFICFRSGARPGTKQEHFHRQSGEMWFWFIPSRMGDGVNGNMAE